MGPISWIILGALAGWIASKIMGTDAQQGGCANVVVGIVGAMIGGLIMSLVGGGRVDGLNIPSLFTATLGSVVLLYIVKALRK